MTQDVDQRSEAEITSKLYELVSCMCIVESREGDRRGMIDRIESVILRKNFSESFDASRFKVHLTSGEDVIVPGSDISEIESTAAGIDLSRKRNSGKRLPGRPKAIHKTKLIKKVPKGKRKKSLQKKPKAIATKTSKVRQRRTPDT